MRYVTFIALLLCVPVCRALPTTRPSKPLLPEIPESDDPFGDITDQMTDVLGDLASKKTDQPVQEKQQQIVANLDALIAEIEKQQKQQSNGNGNTTTLNPSKPMSDSMIAGGPGGIHGLKDPKAGTRNFGNLPPRDRDAILQSKTEGFPPGYESLLQSYYQRLAQEKPANTP